MEFCCLWNCLKLCWKDIDGEDCCWCCWCCCCCCCCCCLVRGDVEGGNANYSFTLSTITRTLYRPFQELFNFTINFQLLHWTYTWQHTFIASKFCTGSKSLFLIYRLFTRWIIELILKTTFLRVTLFFTTLTSHEPLPLMNCFWIKIFHSDTLINFIICF